jgi:hypothetical protein
MLMSPAMKEAGRNRIPIRVSLLTDCDSRRAVTCMYLNYSAISESIRTKNKDGPTYESEV